MKKLTISLLLISAFVLISCSGKPKFPVSEWNDDLENNPIIFYLSGDGGFNSFSKEFAAELHGFGYDVFALNSRDYFWKKKTPLQASQDVENYLKTLISKRKNKEIILLGYSFGADVSPFIYNRFDADFKKNIKKMIIIGPSKVNNFEVDLQELITGKMQYGYSVPHEINQLKNVDFTMIASDLEYKYFPLNEITLKNYHFEHIPGDHHFDGNTEMLTKKIEPFLK